MLSSETNKGIIQCLNLSMEYCAKCNTCANACHVFEASGYNEIYRPTYRAEVLRMIVKKYFTKSGKLMAKFVGADIDLTWEVVARLGEERLPLQSVPSLQPDLPVSSGQQLVR